MPPALFRSLRIRKHADYGAVYSVSRKHASASLSFFYRDRKADPETRPTPGTPRFGITVPRALGGAVVRNRIKRRVRVAARSALPALPGQVDVVLHPRSTVATMPFPALEAEIAAVFATVARKVAANAPNTPLPRPPRGGKKRR